ncbi:hypothetical protein NL676_033722 [Syzygium grande]|nr:hypothetical protein NL676_033722 [Syzygium grande]
MFSSTSKDYPTGTIEHSQTSSHGALRLEAIRIIFLLIPTQHCSCVPDQTQEVNPCRQAPPATTQPRPTRRWQRQRQRATPRKVPLKLPDLPPSLISALNVE